jgi:hypothetical protein
VLESALLPPERQVAGMMAVSCESQRMRASALPVQQLWCCPVFAPGSGRLEAIWLCREIAMSVETSVAPSMHTKNFGVTAATYSSTWAAPAPTWQKKKRGYTVCSTTWQCQTTLTRVVMLSHGMSPVSDSSQVMTSILQDTFVAWYICRHCCDGIARSPLRQLESCDCCVYVPRIWAAAGTRNTLNYF